MNARRDDDVLSRVDKAAFARDLDALRKELDASLGPDDHAHLKKLARWGRACTAAGYATAWLGPNVASMALLSTGAMARWAIVMHHVGHKALDRIDGVPERETSRGFAQGRRRWVDWLDWMHPDAWRHEHNVLHHFHTGEESDPDLVELNTEAIRRSRAPRAAKLAAVAFYALSWRLTYYAPNTFQIWRRSLRRRKQRGGAVEDDARGEGSYLSAFDARTADGRAFLAACVLPYGLARFVAAPLAFAPLGPLAVASVWVNSVGAEALTNLYTFVLIAPNHAGDDLHRFSTPTRDRGDFYLRQVLGSVDYATGGDARDFLHGFLNYQIEHHLFPDLPPRAYQRAQPRVREICEKHGVPYVQEGVAARVKKLVQIMIGDRSMRQA